MRKEGVIGVPDESGKMTRVWYQAKIYDLPSEYGIEGGRISKLQLRVGRKPPVCAGEIVANYDRGWDVKPKTRAAEVALAVLLLSYK